MKSFELGLAGGTFVLLSVLGGAACRGDQEEIVIPVDHEAEIRALSAERELQNIEYQASHQDLAGYLEGLPDMCRLIVEPLRRDRRMGGYTDEEAKEVTQDLCTGENEDAISTIRELEDIAYSDADEVIKIDKDIEDHKAKLAAELAGTVPALK